MHRLAVLVALFVGCASGTPAPLDSAHEVDTAASALRAAPSAGFSAAPRPTWTDDEAVVAFDAAAAKHDRQLRDLYDLRGTPPPNDTLMNYALVTRALAAATPSYPASTAVLFYAPRDGGVDMWLIDKSGLRGHVRRAIHLNALDGYVALLRASMGVDEMAVARGVTRSGVPPTLAARLLTSSMLAEVSTSLLPPPIAEALDGVEHLVVVPTLGIGTVPFAMLRGSGAEPLIERMTISIAASLWDLAQAHPPWREPAAHGVLAVGNPTMPALEGWKFGQLAGSEHEARLVGQAFESTPLVGADATEAAVAAAAPDADLLHFATHGISGRQEALDNSFLVFAAGDGYDGKWTAREIQRLPLTAQLAVLSACQTGLGQVHEAGVIGLARAFQKANVPRVIMSLWSVSDAATAFLMVRLVDHLKDGNVPAVALREAMLDTRKDFPDPKHWAPFVLLGSPR